MNTLHSYLLYRHTARIIKKFGVVAFLSLFLFPYCCDAWPARVVNIKDSDIIEVIYNKKRLTIHLYGIDCPEKSQPYGNSTIRLLSKKMRGKKVEIAPVLTDQQGRVMAMIYIGDECVNETLIKKGLAWVYPEYCRKEICVKWNQMQHRASMASKGLWNRMDSVPPWLWRARRESR